MYKRQYQETAVDQDRTTYLAHGQSSDLAVTACEVAAAVALESEGNFHTWQHDITNFKERYEHALWRELEAEATTSIGHGGMDFVMLWRIAWCLRNGVPLDQNVYDAAAWSAVTPLSEASNADRGNSKDFPDFTRGAWKSAKPVTVA